MHFSEKLYWKILPILRSSFFQDNHICFYNLCLFLTQIVFRANIKKSWPFSVSSQRWTTLVSTAPYFLFPWNQWNWMRRQNVTPCLPDFLLINNLVNTVKNALYFQDISSATEVLPRSTTFLLESKSEGRQLLLGITFSRKISFSARVLSPLT